MDGWRILTIWECALKGRNKLPINDVMAKTAKWLREGDAHCEITGFRDKPDDTKYFP